MNQTTNYQGIDYGTLFYLCKKQFDRKDDQIQGESIMKYEIGVSRTQLEVNEAVEAAACRLNIDLDNSMSYAENAEFLRSEAENPKNHDSVNSLTEMAEILDNAETRWFQIEERG